MPNRKNKGNNKKTGDAGKVNIKKQAGKDKVRKMRTMRAGLIMRVPKVEEAIRKEWPSQVSSEAAVPFAAAVEYILKKILDDAAIIATENRTLLPTDIQESIKQNSWTNKLITGRVGGVCV